jgi:hypothetical protein
MTEVFNIQLPDGRVVGIQANSPEEAAQGAKNILMREGGTKKATEAGKAGGLENFVRSAANTLSFGSIDELKAKVQSSIPGVIDFMNRDLFTGEVKNPTPRGPDAYDQILEQDRAQSKAYAKEYPWWDAGGKITGGVLGLSALSKVPGVGPAITGSSPGLWGWGRSALAGGGLSVPYGFGEGEGGFDQRATSAGKHGVIGVLGSAALHPLLGAGGALVNAAVESPAGRYVADKVAGPAVRMMGGVVDSLAPKVVPKSLSAAAPEGTSVAADSVLGRVSEALTGAAPNSEEILANAAARRIATAMQRGSVGDAVPGFRMRMDELGVDAMPLDANPMTQRLATTTFISPGAAPRIIDTAMDARNAATGERVGGSVRQAFGETNPAVLEAQRLRLQRGTEGTGNYADAVGPDAPYVISPAMRQLMQETPAIRAAMDRIERDAANQGVRLTPAQVAHRVKQQLSADADAAYGGRGLAPNKADVGSTAERWRTALHEANPAIRTADEAWQAGSARMEALDLGRQFMKQGVGEVADAVSPAILAERIPRMTAEEAQAFLAGAADTIYVRTNSGPNQARQITRAFEENQNLRHKLVTMLGEDNANILFNRAMSEKAFARSDRRVRGGSDTAQKVASLADEAAMGDLPTTPTGLIQKGLSSFAQWYAKQAAGNEAVRGQVARMLTERDPVAQAELIRRIEAELARQAQPRTLQRGVVPSLSGEL